MPRCSALLFGRRPRAAGPRSGVRKNSGGPFADPETSSSPASKENEVEEDDTGGGLSAAAPQSCLNDGPILADFLAMGAGRMAPTPPGPAASPLRPPRVSTAALIASPPAASATPSEAVSTPAVRERWLVEAALQRSEVLGQALLETPPRATLEPPRRSPGRMPKIFMEAYGDYIALQGGESAETGAEGVSAGSRSRSTAEEAGSVRTGIPLRGPRLRIRPWHRTAMQKMLCQAVLFHFLQELREALGLRVHERPLCAWEVWYAAQMVEKGEVVELVKYLAETELHIRHGPMRRKLVPAGQVGADETQRVRAERRQLALKWGMRRHNLEEDVVLRVFMDGRLCWSSVRGLLLGSDFSVSVSSTTGIVRD